MGHEPRRVSTGFDRETRPERSGVTPQIQNESGNSGKDKTGTFGSVNTGVSRLIKIE